MVAAALTPVYAVIMLGVEENTFAILFMSLILIWRHQSNIINLLAGKEGQIGEKKSPN